MVRCSTSRHDRARSPDTQVVYTLCMAWAPIAVVREPLSVEAISAAVEADARHRGEGCGGLCAFVGVVRVTHQGRRVRHLEYEAHEPLALKAFARIADEADGHWPTVRLAIHHRVGRLEPGEASIVVVAASAHRADAFRACRYAIERVKQIAPIWKHEFFEDGDVWVDGVRAEPDDERMRREALERACV